MALIPLGKIKVGSGGTVDGKWDDGSRDVHAGPWKVGKAGSAGEAAKLAEAYCARK